MKKWEYISRWFDIEGDNQQEEYQDALNSLGEEGWELVSVVNGRTESEHSDGVVDSFAMSVFATFKREKS